MAKLGLAWQGGARQGAVWQGKEVCGTSKPQFIFEDGRGMVWRGVSRRRKEVTLLSKRDLYSWRGKAWHGTARRGMAKQGSLRNFKTAIIKMENKK